MILPLTVPLILTLLLPLVPSLRQVIRVNHAPVAHSAAGRRYAWLGLGLGLGLD